MIVFGKREFASFVARTISPRQLEIFCAAGLLQGLTFSGIVRELSKNYPQSTVKYVLKFLRSAGLLDFENGQPMQFTKLGSFIKEGVENENNN